MKGINNCICGLTPLMDVRLWTTYPKGYYMQCKCGRKTMECFTAEDAIKEWNEMNFPTCSECDYFNNGLCKMHDTVTQKTWTCPDYRKADKTPSETQTEANNDTLGHYDIDEMLAKVDWQKEFIKSAADYYELADEKNRWEKEWNILYDKHEKAVDNYEAMLEEVRAKLWKAEDEIKYWTGEYNKVVQENEKLHMKMDQIKEVVE
jgi:hypothetical protein